MISNANERIDGLQEELEACRTKVVPVEDDVHAKLPRVPESIITFRQGKIAELTPHNFLERGTCSF